MKKINLLPTILVISTIASVSPLCLADDGSVTNVTKQANSKQKNINQAQTERTNAQQPNVKPIADASTTKTIPVTTPPITVAIDPVTNSKVTNAYPVKIPSLLTLQQAQKALTQVSPKLAAEQANIQAKEWQREAVETVDDPLVFARASATAYKVRRDIDLSQTKQNLANGIDQAQSRLHGRLASRLGQLGIQLPSNSIIPPLGNAIADKLPDSYEFSRSDQSISAGVGFVYPLYTAGRVDALEGVLDARTFEAQAQSKMSEDQLYTLLVERYFNAQLAIIAAALRKDAFHTIEQTDHMAQRMYEEGFISLVQRMEAQSALADAQSEFVKARNTSRLAMMSLQRLLRTTYRIKPTTPLFISTKPLQGLDYYQNIALKNHPALTLLQAKREQAEQLHQFSDTQYKPTVSMFGYADIDTKPSWVAGVSATWTFTGGLDKSALLSSSNAQIRQVDLSALEVKDNLLLLVEKNWHDVTNAQARYQALQTNVNLSYKVLELRKLGMQEGVNTALDVVQAQTQYLKASTEQAQAVNDYVQALAKLMESCGTPLAFNDYIAKADVRLPQLYQQDTSQTKVSRAKVSRAKASQQNLSKQDVSRQDAPKPDIVKQSKQVDEQLNKQTESALTDQVLTSNQAMNQNPTKQMLTNKTSTNRIEKRNNE